MNHASGPMIFRVLVLKVMQDFYDQQSPNPIVSLGSLQTKEARSLQETCNANDWPTLKVDRMYICIYTYM